MVNKKLLKRAPRPTRDPGALNVARPMRPPTENKSKIRVARIPTTIEENTLATLQGPVTGNITLNGSRINNTFNGKVVIASVTNESSINFRVDGFDSRGIALSEVIVGPGAVIGSPYNGLVLFTPKVQEYYTYLIDKNGNEENFLNIWGPHPSSTGGQGSVASAAYLKSDGKMIYPCKWIINNDLTSAAQGGRIIIYDWDDPTTPLWDWTIPAEWGYLPHHDIEPLVNGNILLIVIENNSYRGTSDAVIEIQPDYTNNTASIVWEWHVTDHLDDTGVNPFKFSTTLPAPISDPSRNDWNHFNSIYLNELDRIYLSSRNWDEFFVIPWRGGTDSTGDILYRWGNPQNYGRGDNSWHKLNANHSVNETPANYPGGRNVMIFNNEGQIDESIVIEINPPMDGNGNYILNDGEPFGPQNTTWEYSNDFHSARQCGTFRLPNGHTFVIVAGDGDMFDVDTNGNTIWALTPSADVLRAHQYPTDYSSNRGIRTTIGTKEFSRITSISTQGAITNGKISVGLKFNS